jgi:hypothetical protein
VREAHFGSLRWHIISNTSLSTMTERTVRTGMLFTSRLEKRAEPSTHSWRCCKASMCRRSSNGKKDLISCTHDRLPLRILNRMKIGYLIQDVRRIELKNLIAKREGGSFITGDVAIEHVSPSVGDASLVIEGEEFAGNVVRYTESQVIFESDRFEEIAKKLS